MLCSTFIIRQVTKPNRVFDWYCPMAVKINFKHW
jgi:hypothetical protein